MDVNSWTREENEQFKNALQFYSPFLPTRFESIAQNLQKSVIDVMEHYQELVDDLSEIGSMQIALPYEVTDAIAQNLFPVNLYPFEGTIWNKQEHEWFLIGLTRFGMNWDKIAELVNSKNQMQVAIYAHNYFHWQKTKKNVMKRRRGNDITMMDINVDSTGQQVSLVHLQSQPQQGKIVLEIGQPSRTSYTESHLP